MVTEGIESKLGIVIEGIGELFSEYFSNFEGKLYRITLSKSLFVTTGLISGY